MFLTKEDYLKIEAYLKLNAKKDSDFELLDIATESYTALGETSRVVVNLKLPNGNYKNSTLNFRNVLKGFIATRMLPSEMEVYNYAEENKSNLATVELIWNAIHKYTTDIPLESLALSVRKDINTAIKTIKIDNVEYSTDRESSNKVILNPKYASSQTCGGKADDSIHADNASKADLASVAIQAYKVVGNLMFGMKSYNGSENAMITREDLGIGEIYNFIGVSSQDPTDASLNPSGAIVDNYTGTWKVGTSVYYDGNSYILIEEGNLPANWVKGSSVEGYITEGRFLEVMADYSTTELTCEDINGASQQAILEAKSYTDDKVLIINNALESKYEKPNTGIPYSDLNEQIQDAVDYAQDYHSNIATLEHTTRKIDDWNSYIPEDEDTLSEMYYPTARLLKECLEEVKDEVLNTYNIIGTLEYNIGDTNTLVHTDSTGKISSDIIPKDYDLDEILTKILKTSTLLTANKSLIEVDDNSNNNTVTFTGKLEIETFGTGKSTIKTDKYTNYQFRVDNDTVDQGISSTDYTKLLEHTFDTVKTSGQLDSNIIKNHNIKFYVTYKGDSYESNVCNVAVNLRKFFFFGEFNSDVLSAFEASLSGTASTINNCTLDFGNDVVFNGISHFSNTKGCTISVPSNSTGSTSKYIYFLIPSAMVGTTLSVKLPDAFDAPFAIQEITQVSRNIRVRNTDNPYDTYVYRVFRSTNPINSLASKRLTIY